MIVGMGIISLDIVLIKEHFQHAQKDKETNLCQQTEQSTVLLDRQETKGFTKAKP